MIAEWMEVGLGMMDIEPRVFWSLTMREWLAKQRGHLRRLQAQGGKDAPLSRADRAAILAMNEKMSARHGC